MAWYSEESQIELQKRAAKEIVTCSLGGLPEAIANPAVLKTLRRNDWTPNHSARWRARRAEMLEITGQTLASANTLPLSLPT